jgi:hypothetical protein
MLVMWLLLVALGVMRFFPDTEVGRFLRRWMVEKPANWLSQLTPAKAAKWLVLAPIVAVMVIATPELLPLLAVMGDAGLVLELLLLLWMAAFMADLRSIRSRIAFLGRAIANITRRIMPRRQHNARAKRRPTQRPGKPGDSSGEPGFGLAFA